KLVERFDTDKDGNVSRLELARSGPQVVRLAERLVRDTPKEIERQLKRIEREQGELAKRFDEPPRPADRPMGGQGRAIAMFRGLDTNQDGVVELDEVPERLARRARRWMNQGDADNDNKLTLQEFRGVFSAEGLPARP